MKKRILSLLLCLVLVLSLLPMSAFAADTSFPITVQLVCGSFPVVKTEERNGARYLADRTEYQTGMFLYCQLSTNTYCPDYYEIQYRKEGGEWTTGSYLGNFWDESPDIYKWYPGVYIPLTGNDIYGVYQVRQRYAKYNPVTRELLPNDTEPWLQTQSIWAVFLQTETQRTAGGIQFSWNAVAGAEGYLLKKKIPDMTQYASVYASGGIVVGLNSNLLRWQTFAEIPKTKTSYFYALDTAEAGNYQLVCYKQDPFGAAGDLVYSLAGVNCYESYDWMPLPTDLKAEATDNGILLKWCAPNDAPVAQYDLMNYLSGNPTLWWEYCMNHGLDPDTARHDPKIHFCVERSEDGGVTWSPYPYRGFYGEDSDNNQYLDKEVYLGKTYTYRISASQNIIFDYAHLLNNMYTICYEHVTYTSGTTAPVSVTCDVAPTVITAADCTVVIPRDGNHPVRTVATAADAPYTVDSVSWREAGATDNMKDEDVFIAGKVYDVRVDYKAKPGYVFSETTKLTVNGKPALGPFNSLTFCGLQFTAERKADISPSVSLTGWTYGGTRNSPVVSGNPGNAEVIFYSKAKGADDSTYIAALPENAGNYTLKALVDATDDYYGGTATCDFTIAKADGPAAPAGLTGIGPTSVNGTDGKITGVSAEMEYSSADSFASATSCTGNEITGLTAGTYYVRIRENMNYRAGGAATVTVPAYTPCTVTFDANGHGTAPAAQRVASGSKAEKPSDLTEAGWVFGGWYQETACTNAYDFETPVTADITVYAKWTKNTTPPTTTYTVSFNMNGHGNQVAAQTVNEGAKATKPADPTAEGWTFGGWYADATFSVTFDFTAPITADTIVYAKWTKNPKLEVKSLPGDVDGDGKLSAADARLALRKSVGLEDYKEGSNEFLACDVDHDGKVSAADARLILRASVGLEDPQKW